MRKSIRTATRSLLLLAVVGLGPSLGCVDLAPPWEASDGADARGNVAGGAGGAGGGGGEGGSASEDAADASPSDDASRPDAEAGPTPGNDVRAAADASPGPTDGAPVDGSAEASDAGLTDGLADHGTDRPDSPPDVLGQSPDGHDDSAVRDSRDAGNEDRAPDRAMPGPDSGPAETGIETSPPPADTSREAPALTGLVASYPCESASGAVLADVSGHGKNATLANGSGGSTPTGFSFAAGKVGSALTLSSADKAYVSLPTGIVAQLSQVTIATWVKLGSSVSFQRVFDFGMDTSTFMYLTNSSSSGGVRFRIASASGKNQIVEGGVAIPQGTWTHVAVTLGDDGVAVYLDGTQVAQQAPAVLRPSDLGETGNNFIGRSPFTVDPYLGGQIDEFRIYDRVLSSSEIAELASGR